LSVWLVALRAAEGIESIADAGAANISGEHQADLGQFQPFDIARMCPSERRLRIGERPLHTRR